MVSPVESILAEVHAAAFDPDARIVRRWRDGGRGRVVVGSCSPYFPTELCEALGMLHWSQPDPAAPVDILFGTAPLPQGAHPVGLPTDVEAADAVPCWETRLGAIARKLETACGRTLTPIYLRAAIHQLEEQRSLLRRLEGLRCRRPGSLSYADLLLVRRLGMRVPRRTYARLLEELVLALGRLAPDPKPRTPVVLLTLDGAPPAATAVEAAERFDLVIVADNLWPGEGLCAVPRADGSALTVLAETYVEGARLLPAPFNPRLSLAEFAIAQVREHAAQAVLLALPACASAAEAEGVMKALDRSAIEYLTLLPTDAVLIPPLPAPALHAALR